MKGMILTPEQAKEARTVLGLSQGKVATELGINRSYLSQFESGRYLFNDEKLAALRGFYEVGGFEFDDPDEGVAGSGARLGSLRLMDGFVVPAQVEDAQADDILSEYAENSRRIRRLAERQVERGFFGIVDDEDLEGCKRDVLLLMARNYSLIEQLHGHRVIKPCAVVEGDTLGEYVGLDLAESLGECDREFP